MAIIPRTLSVPGMNARQREWVSMLLDRLDYMGRRAADPKTTTNRLHWLGKEWNGLAFVIGRAVGTDALQRWIKEFGIAVPGNARDPGEDAAAWDDVWREAPADGAVDDGEIPAARKAR